MGKGTRGDSDSCWAGFGVGLGTYWTHDEMKLSPDPLDLLTSISSCSWEFGRQCYFGSLGINFGSAPISSNCPPKFGYVLYLPQCKVVLVNGCRSLLGSLGGRFIVTFGSVVEFFLQWTWLSLHSVGSGSVKWPKCRNWGRGHNSLFFGDLNHTSVCHSESFPTNTHQVRL